MWQIGQQLLPLPYVAARALIYFGGAHLGRLGCQKNTSKIHSPADIGLHRATLTRLYFKKGPAASIRGSACIEGFTEFSVIHFSDGGNVKIYHTFYRR